MELRIVTPSGQKPQPPPLWFVSNGELTVGPVKTDLLVRGVHHERVPSDCWVRELHWRSWRALWQVREVAPLLGYGVRRPVDAIVRQQGSARQAGPELGALPLHELMAAARDPGECLHFALHAALVATRAAVGMVHVFEEPWTPPITTIVSGPGTLGLLGKPLPRRDLALGAARARCLVLGPPGASGVHGATATRLGGGGRCFGGVALVPLQRDDEVVALLELGKVEHDFRASDGPALARIVVATALRLRDLHN